MGSAATAELARLTPFCAISGKTRLRERQSRCPLEPVLGFAIVFHSDYYFSSSMSFSKILERFSSRT